MAATWITPAGSLGIIPELQYYNLNLETYSPGSAVSYTLIAGNLPPGLGLAANGNISGNTLNVNGTVTSNFTVRATDTVGTVSDRGFNLTVASTLQPNIVPNTGALSFTIAGSYFEQQFTLVDPSNVDNTSFIILAGNVAPNLVLSANGNLKGYVEPVAGNVNFGFDIRATDDTKFDNNYFTQWVLDRKTMTADSTYYSTDNVSIITADTSSLYSPFLVTPAGVLGNVRQNNRFNVQIEATDYDNDYLTFELVSGSLPTGLSLTANTGWITGNVPVGNVSTVTSTFSVKAYKRFNTEYVTDTRQYTINVIGQIDEEINWTTSSNLGTINNGEISNLYVEADLTSGSQLQYSLVGNGIGGLPIGLDLLPDGVIAGRVSFDLAGNSQTYTFTIRASDVNGLVTSDREFTVQVLKRNSRPYENLYIQLLPTRSGREIYNNLITNTDIIPPSYVYRYWDPWYSRNTLRRVLFLTGLNPDTDSQYINAIALNHYWKTLCFGEVKTAVAKDDNFNTVYEVVYLEIKDNQVNAAGLGPNIAESVPTNSMGVTTVYPNSFPNMIERLADNIGYQDRGILPLWMTSRQDDGTVLGFTRALVLVYVYPGRSAEVAYRISNAIEDFNLLDFTIDRYEWDSILSNNFIKTNETVTATGNITANTSSNIVTGNSTVFLSEVTANAIIYVNDVALGNVVTINSNTEIILDSNSASNVANLSFTYSNIFPIFNNYVVATGNISANTTSNLVTGILSNVSGTGTITGNTESTTITGSGTTFTTEAKVGKNIYVAGNSIGIIRSIISANTISVFNPLSSNITGASFEVEGTTTAFTSELHIGDAIVVNTNVILGYVSSITNDISVNLTANSTANVNNLSYSHTYRDPYTTPTTGDKYLKYPQFGVLS